MVSIKGYLLYKRSRNNIDKAYLSNPNTACFLTIRNNEADQNVSQMYSFVAVSTNLSLHIPLSGWQFPPAFQIFKYIYHTCLHSSVQRMARSKMVLSMTVVDTSDLNFAFEWHQGTVAPAEKNELKKGGGGGGGVESNNIHIVILRSSPTNNAQVPSIRESTLSVSLRKCRIFLSTFTISAKAIESCFYVDISVLIHTYSRDISHLLWSSFANWSNSTPFKWHVVSVNIEHVLILLEYPLRKNDRGIQYLLCFDWCYMSI